METHEAKVNKNFKAIMIFNKQEIFESKFHSNKSNAEREVELKMIKYLWSIGLLDEYLEPNIQWSLELKDFFIKQN